MRSYYKDKHRHSPTFQELPEPQGGFQSICCGRLAEYSPKEHLQGGMESWEGKGPHLKPPFCGSPPSRNGQAQYSNESDQILVPVLSHTPHVQPILRSLLQPCLLAGLPVCPSLIAYSPWTSEGQPSS